MATEKKSTTLSVGRYRTVNLLLSTHERLARAKRELSFDRDIDLSLDQVIAAGLDALAEAGEITPDDEPAVPA